MRSSDFSPRLSASRAKAIRQRDRYSIGAQPRVSENLAANADRDIDADIKKMRKLTGDKLDREFARIVLELDRDLVRVSEDGARDASTGSIKNHLDDEITFLRGEMGEADRLVRERR